MCPVKINLNYLKVSTWQYADKVYKISFGEDCFYLEGNILMQSEEEKGFAVQIAKYFILTWAGFFKPNYIP